jgi:hypothetical protein
MVGRIATGIFLLAALCAMACSDGSAAERPAARALDETGRYPADISPPPGTQYPCALTALPRGLPGIARADREYINRTYARILRATQAKLVALKALYDRRDISGATSGTTPRSRVSSRPCGPTLRRKDWSHSTPT